VGPSLHGGKITQLQTNLRRSERSLQSILTHPLPVSVALRFKPKDAKKLWDLAYRHAPADDADFTWFATAARATERGLPAVIDVENGEAVREAVAFFVRHGIEPPEIEELRI
jgi:hypothetical protein